MFDTQIFFKDQMTQQNREIYYRLKFRALTQKDTSSSQEINYCLLANQQTLAEICAKTATNRYHEIFSDLDVLRL